MGKKNLDKLFQEKFKNFSELPDESLWQSIETSLDQKKKSRKAVPLWWKLGGIAAILAVGFFLWNPFDDLSSKNPVVTDTNEKIEAPSEQNSPKEKDKEQILDLPSSKETQIVSQEDNFKDDGSIDVVVNNANIDKTFDSKSDSSKNSSDKILTPANERRIIGNNKKTEIGNSKEQITANNRDDAFSKANVGTVKEAVVVNGKRRVSAAKEGNQNNVETIGLKETNESEATVQTSGEKLPEERENPKKKSIFDEIAAQQEEDLLAENAGSKWSAGPSVAPVYFDAMGQGSPVHSIFVPNSKSGDVNLSYGLTVAYEVSKKLSIRSGVHKVDYGYNTDDIQFSSSLNAASNSQIDNVDYAVTARNLVVSSKTTGEVVALNQNPFLDTSSEISAATTSRDGTMEQQFGYVEVPVELNYTLIDKKFGVSLIGGVSSLFLVDNSIQLTSGELTTEVGEANNVNNVNFSTNVGFGINYKFTPKVKLNIEPMFKYQLNTFSQTEGTFQPFSVGVYSGLSFKF